MILVNRHLGDLEKALELRPRPVLVNRHLGDLESNHQDELP